MVRIFCPNVPQLPLQSFSRIAFVFTILTNLVSSANLVSLQLSYSLSKFMTNIDPWHGVSLPFTLRPVHVFLSFNHLLIDKRTRPLSLVRSLVGNFIKSFLEVPSTCLLDHPYAYTLMPIKRTPKRLVRQFHLQKLCMLILPHQTLFILHYVL